MTIEKILGFLFATTIFCIIVFFVLLYLKEKLKPKQKREVEIIKINPTKEFKYSPVNCRNCGGNVSTKQCEYCGTFVDERQMVVIKNKKSLTNNQRLLICGAAVLLGVVFINYQLKRKEKFSLSK